MPNFTEQLAFPPLAAFAPLICSFKIDLIAVIESCKFDLIRKLLYFLKNKFYDKHYSSDIIIVYYVNVDYVIKVWRLFKMKLFVYGRIPTFFFFSSDDFERIFVTRRWVHNFFLEIT